MTRWQKVQLLLVVAMIGFGAENAGVLPFYVIGVVGIFAGAMVYRRLKPEPTPPPPPKSDVVDLSTDEYEFLNKDGQWETHVPAPSGVDRVGSKLLWVFAAILVGLALKFFKGF